MSDHRLSKIQKNQVAELARGKGLALADFRWVDAIDSDQTSFSSLHHTPTAARVQFGSGGGMTENAFWLNWWPNFTGKRTYDWFQSWPDVLRFTDAWLAAVAQEVEAVDLWEVAREERAWLTESPSGSSNTQFTNVERELIAQHLKTIESYVAKNSQLISEQHIEVKEQLEYLAEATNRLGRFDWRGLAAATFIGIVLQLGLTPEHARELMQLATQLLGPLLAGTARLLGR